MSPKVVSVEINKWKMQIREVVVQFPLTNMLLLHITDALILRVRLNVNEYPQSIAHVIRW